jgi:O-methyltransferase involved in polyketide biosynthesis
MKQKINVKNIADVPETMLITLWARAAETQIQNPIIKDPKALEIITQIDYDFAKFSKARLTQVGVAIRTMLFDRLTKDFLKTHPGAVVINLGAGLDTRFHRLKNEAIGIWYDIDLPNVIQLRQKFIETTERNNNIAKSVFDYSWMEEIQHRDKPVLIIAEGLFMYFKENDLKSLFNQLVSHFPEAELLIELLPPLLVGKSKHHDTVKNIEGNAEFVWGLKNGKDLESWNEHIHYLNEWKYFDYHRERWGFMRWLTLIPGIKNIFSNKIIHLKFS